MISGARERVALATFFVSLAAICFGLVPFFAKSLIDEGMAAAAPGAALLRH